ncbi:DUF4931 domain-containing protein [Streptococcus sp. zg-JUN1979]|uniref:DUF4931 domain-containing protein n=1 Tax=Streptococcus sp. zg-JUN1979 TaxID=3391450 RepID=UPI0039A63690
MADPLIFDTDVARQKPSNADACPFCDRKQLARILDEKDDMLWIDNKYQTIKQAYQTLVIETKDHKAHFANYSRQKAFEVLSYFLSCWEKLRAKDGVQSVIAFKNFGALSGGSLEHSHMQLVAFTDRDAHQNIRKEHLIGALIYRQDGVDVNVSSHPFMGITEFNICAKSLNRTFSNLLQDVIRYVLTRLFSGRCNSYNLFFITQEDKLVCKVVPRFVTSPYFIGYGLTQVASPISRDELQKDMKDWLEQVPD